MFVRLHAVTSQRKCHLVYVLSFQELISTVLEKHQIWCAGFNGGSKKDSLVKEQFSQLNLPRTSRLMS